LQKSPSSGNDAVVVERVVPTRWFGAAPPQCIEENPFDLQPCSIESDIGYNRIPSRYFLHSSCILHSPVVRRCTP
jgi:hypothetical protein